MKYSLRDNQGRFSKRPTQLKSNNIFIGCGAGEQATGCEGADTYHSFALKNGFRYIEVLDWSSSAGDWQFLVSTNGNLWYILSQTNNYPRPGFTHTLDSVPWYGTLEEVYKQIEEVTCG